MPLKIDTPLNNGKLDIWLENITAGAYSIGIGYLLKPGSAPVLIGGCDGKMKPLDNKNTSAAHFTYIYLNPEQAREYKLYPFIG
ncbi:hypothetical protein [Niabella hirudinis]|uniref:hypothetical protein n=1 Tax=Niabella hirudinis TaxID=1285929 RepID=UPI003EBE60AC